MRTLFFQLPAIARVLGGSSTVQQIRLYVRLVCFYVVTRFFVRMYQYQITLRFHGTQFLFTLGSIVDIGVLEEIFVKEQYKWTLTEAPKTVLDLGAHGGETVIYYKILYPQATVCAVEPDPVNLERLTKNVSAFSDVHILAAAVSDVDGEITLFQSDSTLGNNIVRPRKQARSETSVQAYTLETIAAQCQIVRFDLIKFDIEGAEEMVFSGRGVWDLSDKYIGEVHGDLMSGDPMTLINRFKSRGPVVVTEPFSTRSRYFIQAG